MSGKLPNISLDSGGTESLTLNPSLTTVNTSSLVQTTTRMETTAPEKSINTSSTLMNSFSSNMPVSKRVRMCGHLINYYVDGQGTEYSNLVITVLSNPTQTFI